MVSSVGIVHGIVLHLAKDLGYFALEHQGCTLFGSPTILSSDKTRDFTPPSRERNGLIAMIEDNIYPNCVLKITLVSLFVKGPASTRDEWRLCSSISAYIFMHTTSPIFRNRSHTEGYFLKFGNNFA